MKPELTMTAVSQPLKTQPARLGYIVSASHSGSTLLAMLLGVQPGAFTVGELRAPNVGNPDLYVCSCDEKIRQCPFWAKVREALARKGIPDFDITRAGTSVLDAPGPYAQRLLAPLQRGPCLELVRDLGLSLSPSWRRHLRQVQQRNSALVEVLQEMGEAEIIIDSSKSVLHLKYLLRNPRLDIKIIHLIRDGRAVTLSRLGHGGIERSSRSETIAAAATEWKRSNEAAECLLRRLPASQWTSVKYEELCGQPEETIRRTGRFLGLNLEQVNLDFRSRPSHVLGNEMRLNSTAEIRLDERWRRQLSAEDLETFNRVAGGMNVKLGYE
jgi:hypothetical protein